MTPTLEPALNRRAPTLALLLACLLAAPAIAMPPPAQDNVTYAYAQVLRATPVYGPVGAGSAERRIVGYDVEYQYKGETYMSRLDRDPGSRLRIRVAITPEGRGEVVD